MSLPEFFNFRDLYGQVQLTLYAIEFPDRGLKPIQIPLFGTRRTKNSKLSVMNSTLNDNKKISYAPGPSPNTVMAPDGSIQTVPDGWTLLAPGDALLTRRVKAAGEYWAVQEKKGRKIFSKGVWAPSTTIEKIKAEVAIERASPAYQKQRVASALRCEEKQVAYEQEFFDAVLSYLDFHQKFADLAERMAHAVADHATPVGSGTVARTQRISIDERAEAAVLAWMRHKTTDYDNLKIPRIKGKRREVRRELAKSSKELLNRYRNGDAEAELLERVLSSEKHS